jgi:hypothetical protein
MLPIPVMLKSDVEEICRETAYVFSITAEETCREAVYVFSVTMKGKARL